MLVTIPHFCSANPVAPYGSTRGNPAARSAALSRCVAALHELFDASHRYVHLAKPSSDPADQATAAHVDVVICTVEGQHVLDELSVPKTAYQNSLVRCPPPMLGFECHAVLRDHLGQYDYFAYLEDDLALDDPWFLLKLRGFTAQAGMPALLQPNRFERSGPPPRRKAYIDGDLAPQTTAPFQNVAQRPQVLLSVLGTPVVCRRTLNPHSGCFFLNAEQMEHWARQTHFLDRDCRFIGPLESAATLGIMRTFRVYKPAAAVASFLEIEHCGDATIQILTARHARARRGRE